MPAAGPEGLSTDVPTVGVEEEFHLVDPRTRMLAPRSVEVLDALEDERFEKELRRSMVETRTEVCGTLGEVRRQLVDLRARLLRATDRAGCRPLATGTAPLGRVHDQPTSPGNRYARMAHLHRELVRSSGVCATHVHVGIDDRDLAVAVMGRVLPWLPAVRALSASSPFWEGHDTGYASYRTIVWAQWPTSGQPEVVSSAADYDRVVQELVRSGTILDPGQIYWDVRLSAAHPTLEFRIADASPKIDETLLIVALCRALVMVAVAAERSGEEPLPRRPALLRAGTWQASRFGLDAELLDPRTGTPVPAHDHVRDLLAHLRPALRAAGDLEIAEALVEWKLGAGNAAQRLRRLFERSARDWHAVVDAAVQDTAAADAPIGPRPTG